MKLIPQTSILAAAVILGVSQGTKAEETKTYETLKVSCNPFATHEINTSCNSDLLVKPETTEIAQSRRRKSRKSKLDRYYGGFSAGIGFPGGGIPDDDTGLPEPEYGTGFVGSLFGGIKFSKNISADLELLLGLGVINTDDLENSLEEIFNSDSDSENNLERLLRLGDIDTDNSEAIFNSESDTEISIDSVAWAMPTLLNNKQ